jgi:hypothetical protein
VYLENEALTIQELEDRRREEEILRGSRWTRRRFNAAGVSPASKSQQGMEESKARTEDLLALLNSGFLREKEIDMWRAAAGDPYPMEKNPDEIPMSTRFVECGLALPASNFFKGLLEYYGIEYLNLNPNGIFHTSVFVHFCEAFLGIKPHWVLFRKFFRVKPQPSANDPRVVGGADIQMREDAAEQYLAYKLIDSNQDWKSKWFYVTDDAGGYPATRIAGEDQGFEGSWAEGRACGLQLYEEEGVAADGSRHPRLPVHRRG